MERIIICDKIQVIWIVLLRHPSFQGVMSDPFLLTSKPNLSKLYPVQQYLSAFIKQQFLQLDQLSNHKCWFVHSHCVFCSSLSSDAQEAHFTITQSNARVLLQRGNKCKRGNGVLACLWQWQGNNHIPEKQSEFRKIRYILRILKKSWNSQKSVFQLLRICVYFGPETTWDEVRYTAVREVGSQCRTWWKIMNQLNSAACWKHFSPLVNIVNNMFQK